MWIVYPQASVYICIFTNCSLCIEKYPFSVDKSIDLLTFPQDIHSLLTRIRIISSLFSMSFILYQQIKKLSTFIFFNCGKLANGFATIINFTSYINFTFESDFAMAKRKLF